MNTIAIIGASYLQRPLVEKAKEMGLRTICFAWPEGAVCRDICDVFYPISIVEKEEILSVCRREKIDGICTIASDVAAPVVAYIANQLGLLGNDYAAAETSYNKNLMRYAFIKADVPCPKYCCITQEQIDGNELGAIPALRTMSLPLIVKPSDRSGSMAVMKVERAEDLLPAITKAQAVSFRHEAMVEEYIEGREISVEYISYKGKHYPLQITDKVTTGSPHFVELEHHQPADLSEAMFAEIYAITENALNALGITNGASHSEYKITKEGRIAVIEIGGRMGGDFIGSDLVQLSTGYDFLRGVIQVALGTFEEPKHTEQLYSGVYFLSADTADVKHYIDHYRDYPEIVKAEQTDDVLRHITCSSDRSGYFVYHANRKFEIKKT